MRWLSANVRRLAIFMVLLGSLGMLASMAICVADVIGTNLFDWPVPGTLEFTESTMVLIVFGALAFTQEKRGHIRVEILYGLFGARVQSFMDLMTHLVALVFFCLLAWYDPLSAVPGAPAAERRRGPLDPAARARRDRRLWAHAAGGRAAAGRCGGRHREGELRCCSRPMWRASSWWRSCSRGSPSACTSASRSGSPDSSGFI
jgi:hypothetical protein